MAFEWHGLGKDLILKRGEPLFDVRFEAPDPAAPVRLVEAERTPELLSFMVSLTDVSTDVNQSFQLFKTARERRPGHGLSRRRARQHYCGSTALCSNAIAP